MKVNNHRFSDKHYCSINTGNSDIYLNNDTMIMQELFRKKPETTELS